MAAAYLFHLCQNHPFVDGNKRVGANAAITFLLTNDWEPTFAEEELVTLLLSVASGGLSKPRAPAARLPTTNSSSRWPLRIGCKNRPNLSQQRRYVLCSRFPQFVNIHSVVAVNEAVSHARNVLPRNFWSLLRVVWEIRFTASPITAIW